MKRSAFLLPAWVALAVFACSSDPDRPPAASSSGLTSSSGAGSSSSGSPSDGSTGDGSSSGGSSGSSDSGSDASSIPAGLRASIDNGAREFSTGTKATRQSNGDVVVASGTDSFGNELRITLTSSAGAVSAGAYNCAGGGGSTYGAIAYTVTGGTATWNALAAGECTITVQDIDNKAGGEVAGIFSGTAKRAASTDYLITKGQFRLTLE